MNTKLERLAQWQAASNQLFRDDGQYRRRHILFLITIVCLSCPLLAVYAYYFGVGLPSFAANLWTIICFGAIMIGVTFRHFHFMNQRIQRYLRSGSQE